MSEQTEIIETEAPAVRISARGSRRLELAGALISQVVQQGGMGIKISESPGETYAHAVLRVINGLNASVQDKIKSDVDWVEAYERAPDKYQVNSESLVPKRYTTKAFPTHEAVTPQFSLQRPTGAIEPSVDIPSPEDSEEIRMGMEDAESLDDQIKQTSACALQDLISSDSSSRSREMRPRYG